MSNSVVNARMIEQWNQQSGVRWTERQPMLDRELAPYTALLLDALPVASGMSALDIGCGCGATTLDLAARVGPGGAVLGVDVSAPMLAHAQQRLAAAGHAQTELRCTDAQVADLGTQRFDLALSRFGVMFFDDPIAAFENVRRALRPGAPLAFVCWRGPGENPWATIPFEAALRHLPRPEASAPDAPGPFAFADPARIARVLTAAGFEAPRITAHDVELPIGDGTGLDATTDFVLDIGPVAHALRLAGGEGRAEVAAAVREALAPYLRDGDVWLAGATWIVTARAPLT